MLFAMVNPSPGGMNKQVVVLGPKIVVIRASLDRIRAANIVQWTRSRSGQGRCRLAGGTTVVHGDLRYDNPAYKLTEEDIRHTVIAAFTGALKSEEMRRSAFNAALRAYRMHHPGMCEGVARRRVAQIICFADWRRSE
jgi:hypothetical protein